MTPVMVLGMRSTLPVWANSISWRKTSGSNPVTLSVVWVLFSRSIWKKDTNSLIIIINITSWDFKWYSSRFKNITKKFNSTLMITEFKTKLTRKYYHLVGEDLNLIGNLLVSVLYLKSQSWGEPHRGHVGLGFDPVPETARHSRTRLKSYDYHQ